MKPLILPAEWHPQDAVLLTWPHEQTDWAPYLSDVEETFFDIAAAVCTYQHLMISCQSFDRLNAIAEGLAARDIQPDQVSLYCVPSNDSWVRDHGPITVLDDGEPVLLDFHFNAWGGKFAFEKDDQITSTLYELDAFGMTQIRHIPYILEGGSIESDGEGTILTTSACLLTPSRNPDADKESVEALFSDCMGVERVLWLDHGYLAGDDTDSHIDTLARFCSTDTICYVHCDNEQDEHYASLKAMKEQLESFRTTDDKPYRLVPLPMAETVLDSDGHRLPATYANFLIINDAVLVPVYGTDTDKQAITQMKECFPHHDIVPVNCSSLIKQHGSLHCVTMQIPEGVLHG